MADAPASPLYRSAAARHLEAWQCHRGLTEHAWGLLERMAWAQGTGSMVGAAGLYQSPPDATRLLFGLGIAQAGGVATLLGLGWVLRRHRQQADTARLLTRPPTDLCWPPALESVSWLLRLNLLSTLAVWAWAALVGVAVWGNRCG